VDTPNAAITIEHPGYYRVGVTGERASFITRRAGRATVTPANGEAFVVAPSEEVVIEGTASPQVSSFAAPPLDAWDQWNYARTDALLGAVSARYVSPGTYGVGDLDRYGTWRVVPTYGRVWVPTAVPAGWAPYTTGAWMVDPYYGWTWLDTAPWGWAPYHYGRWVFVNGFWGWAPGPMVARPIYAPALVAFFGGPNVSVSIGIGGPVVGWVALGWGEPLVPWWGRPGFIHRPWWGGWGGPRIVNNVVISRTTVVNVQNINVYRNASVRNAVVVVNEPHFGRGPITSARITRVDVHSLQPIHTAPKITATPASFVPTARRGIRHSEASLNRTVVATRPPHPRTESASREERNVGPARVPAPAPRLATPPPRHEPASVSPRPRFGQSAVERPLTDRPRPPVSRPAPAQPRPEARLASPLPAASQPQAAGATAPRPATRRPEASRAPAHRLAGEPANRLSPNPAEVRPPEHRERQTPAARPSGAPGNASRNRPRG
jgi:hypothetical protein